MTDMTNARAAVYALREPLVRNCPELTIDRVIGDYCVSRATRRYEYRETTHTMRLEAWPVSNRAFVMRDIWSAHLAANIGREATGADCWQAVY